MRYLDIAAVAQQSGVPASALRYYEEKGLIASVGRRGLRRLFDAGVLEQQAQIIRRKFGDGEIPMPDFWGGYRVVPQRLEFWQGGEHRLHDRFLYRRSAAGDWQIEQLQP